MNRCADLGVVGKEHAAGAVRSRRRKQHAVAVFVAEFVRLQIHEHDDLPAHELFGLVLIGDGGHDDALARAVVQGQLHQLVRFAHGFCRKHLAHAQVELRKSGQLHFRTEGCRLFEVHVLRGENGLCLFGGGLFLLLLFARKIEQVEVASGVDGEQVQVQARAAVAPQNEVVHVLEELALHLFERIFILRLVGVHRLGDGVQLRLQRVERIAARAQEGFERAHARLFGLAHRFPVLPVALFQNDVLAFGRAGAQPEFRLFEQFRKLLLFEGSADLFEQFFHEIGVEIDHAAQLHELAHGDKRGLMPRDQAVFHDALRVLVRRAVAIGFEHLRELEVLPQDLVGETKVEGFERLVFRVQPQDHLGQVQPQQEIGGHVQPRRTAHLAHAALDADEFVPLEQRRLVAEHLARDVLRGIVAAVAGGVVLAARFEVDALRLPAHGPVYLPLQFAVEVFGKVEVRLVPAFAHIVRLGAVLGEGGDRRRILAAVRAEDGNGIIAFALPFLRVLRAVLIEDIENFSALLQGVQNVGNVPSRAVLLRLIMIFHFDAELFDGLHELLFKMRGITFVLAEGVGDVRIRAADVLFKRVVAQMIAHILRDLAKAVVLVPRKEQLRLFARALQCPDDEIARGDVAEVADVHRPRRRDARRADVFLLVRLSADDLLRKFICPIHKNRLSV